MNNEIYQEAVKAFESGDYSETVNKLQYLISKGHVRAHYFLGNLYSNGLGVPYDQEKAISCFRKAAEQGEADAQFALGNAFSFLNKESDAEAFKWFLMAAQQGHALAQRTVSISYMGGVGVEMDEAKGLFWLRKAADQKQAGAQWLLGAMYREGSLVNKDDAEAIRLIKEADKNGEEKALPYLIDHYGEDIMSEPTEAAYYYRKAAEAGNDAALYFLGKSYAEGRGLQQNKISALVLMIVATKRFNNRAAKDAAEAIPHLEKYLSPQQLEQARKIAELWNTGTFWQKLDLFLKN